MRLHPSPTALLLAVLAACSPAPHRPAGDGAAPDAPPSTADRDRAMAAAIDAVTPYIPADSLPVCLSLPPLDTDSAHSAESVVPHLRGARAVRPARLCPTDAGSGPAAYLLTPGTTFFDLPDSAMVQVEVMRSFEPTTYRCMVRPAPAGPRSTCTRLPPGA